MSAAAALMLACFFGWAAIGMPIALAMLSSAFLYLLVTHQDVGLVAAQAMNGLFRSFVLLAVPLFIVAADIMNAGTISERLLMFATLVVGRIRGGLGYVTVVASMIFSGMSGSAIADAAGPGKLMIQMMLKDGRYRPGFAGALTAAAATIGPIIPPSIPMVLYGMVANTSVGYLFLGGVFAGLLMGAALMAVVAAGGCRRGGPPGHPAGRAAARARHGAAGAAPVAPGAAPAGDHAGRDLLGCRDAHRGRRRRRGLRVAAGLRPLPRDRLARGGRAVRGRRALDRRRGAGRGRGAARQLRGRERADPRPDRRLDRLARPLALGLPPPRQPSLPGAGLLPRHAAHAAGRGADRDAVGAGARDRFGPFR